MDSLEFLAGTDIDQTHFGVLAEPLGEVWRGDQNFFVLLMTAANVFQNFSGIQPAVARAKLFHCFVRLEGATAAPAEVITPEEGALGTGVGIENLTHRGLRVDRDSSWAHGTISGSEKLLNFAQHLNDPVDFLCCVVK